MLSFHIPAKISFWCHHIYIFIFSHIHFKTLSYWLHAFPEESHKNLWFWSAVAVRNVFIEDHKREWSQLKKKYTKLNSDKNNVPLILLVVKLIFSLILVNTFFLKQPGIKPFNWYNHFWTLNCHESNVIIIFIYLKEGSSFGALHINNWWSR